MNAKEAIKFFRYHHRERIGYQYVPNYGRDGNIFKQLLEFLSEKELKECILTYFDEKLEWYSPVVLRVNIQKYLAKNKSKRKDKFINPEINRYEHKRKTDCT